MPPVRSVLESWRDAFEWNIVENGNRSIVKILEEIINLYRDEFIISRNNDNKYGSRDRIYSSLPKQI